MQGQHCLSFCCCHVEDPINHLFPCKVHENQWPTLPQVAAATSLSPCCCVETCSLFLLLPKNTCPAALLHVEPSNHRSCLARRADQHFGHRTAGVRGSPVVFQSDRAAGGASQRTSIFAESSPPPLARLRSRMFSRLSLSVGDTTHHHTHSLLGSCGMSNPILWNGFSSSSFYSVLFPLQLVS